MKITLDVGISYTDNYSSVQAVSAKTEHTVPALGAAAKEDSLTPTNIDDLRSELATRLRDTGRELNKQLDDLLDRAIARERAADSDSP